MLVVDIAVVLIAVVGADGVVKAVKGGRPGAVAMNGVAGVEADGLLEDCSAAAAVASGVSIVLTLCNINGCTNARRRYLI